MAGDVRVHVHVPRPSFPSAEPGPDAAQVRAHLVKVHETASALLTHAQSIAAECTALRSLTIDGLEHVRALPDLSAISGLEIHAGEGLAPSVKAWAEAHSGRKDKVGE